MTIPKLNDEGRMADIPLYPEAKITVERRGQIVLIGVNRPEVCNRFDPDAFFGLARAYYDFDNDPGLRAAVFFGHGENFSRGKRDGGTPCATCSPASTGARRRPTGWA